MYTHIRNLMIKKIKLRCKSTEVYSLFNGNTSSIKKILGKEQEYLHPEEVTIDQSASQYYIIQPFKESCLDDLEPRTSKI